VRQDVLEGLISARAARERYGVALDRNLAVDECMTTALRKKLKTARVAGKQPAKKNAVVPRRGSPKAKARGRPR